MGGAAHSPVLAIHHWLGYALRRSAKEAGSREPRYVQATLVAAGVPARSARISGTIHRFGVKALALTYSPKVGEILECDFGRFRDPRLTPMFDGGLPNEIIKHRLAVVLNGKLPNGCCLVIPLSSTGNIDALNRGIHVHVPSHLIPATPSWEAKERWAVTECISHVSKERLFQVKNLGAPVKTLLPRDVVAAIQRAAIKILSASSLLAPPPPAAAAQAR